MPKIPRTVFFDMDGTIAAPLFHTNDGPRTCFPSGEWQAFCDREREASYDACLPVEPALDLARRLRKAGSETCILTIAMSEGEAKAKYRWTDRFGLIGTAFDSIRIVASREDKIACLKEAIRSRGSAGIVDDDLVTLCMAAGTGAARIHVSHVVTGQAWELLGLGRT